MSGGGGGYSTSTAEVPQFVTGTGRVLVRNTFLDVEFDSDDVPVPPQLERSKTAPAAPSGAREEPVLERRDTGVDSSDEEIVESRAAVVDANPEAGEDSGDEVAPKALPLVRCYTREEWEPASTWNWANDDSSTETDTPVLQQVSQANATAPPMPYQAGGMQPPTMYYQVAPQGMAVPMVPVFFPMAMPNNGSNQTLPHPMPPSNNPSDSNSSVPWPPPPPDMAPNIERVPSGSGPPPQVSPTGGRTAADMQQELLAAARSDNASGMPSEVSLPRSPEVAIPQPHTLQRSVSATSSTHRIRWHVDARKLKGNDKQAVSPPFELAFGTQFPSVTFKMMLYPKVVSDAKGGASFKKAKGRGYIQLKCEAELSEAASKAQVKFRIGVHGQEPRGPQSHNFAQSAVCGLPKEEEEWDFNEVVDKDSQTFQVFLEIVPQ